MPRIAERDIEIPKHIHMHRSRGSRTLISQASCRGLVDFIVASAHAKAARIEANVEELSVADSVDDAALEA